ncbi:MAG: hypothetical protein LBH98_05775 [Chitinispirillales bacterium]|nr:hypothetical protein [Chitinispirillales bacterium]
MNKVFWIFALVLFIIGCGSDDNKTIGGGEELSIQVALSSRNIMINEYVIIQNLSASGGSGDYNYYMKKNNGFQKKVGKNDTLKFDAAGTCQLNFWVVDKDKNKSSDWIETITITTGIKGDYVLHKNITASTFWAGEGASQANGNISNVPSAWDEKWGEKYTVNGQAKEDSPEMNFQRDEDFFPVGYDGEENLYYFALPYNDMDNLVFEYEDATSPLLNAVRNFDNNYYEKSKMIYTYAYDERSDRKKNVENIPWYNIKKWGNNESIVKGRWVKVKCVDRGNGEWVYAQWLDAGPFHYDDFDYVFGNDTPRNAKDGIMVRMGAGIDLSPAVFLKMGIKPEDLSPAGTKCTVDWQFVNEEDVPTGSWKRVISNNKIG